MLTLHSIVYAYSRSSTLLFEPETDDLGVVPGRVIVVGMIADALVLIFILTAREIIHRERSDTSAGLVEETKKVCDDQCNNRTSIQEPPSDEELPKEHSNQHIETLTDEDEPDFRNTEHQAWAEA